MTEPRPTVFVVEDDISMREALKNLFRSVDLPVQTFGSAQEYLSSPYFNTPGCLVLDIRLPGCSGIDLQRKLSDEGIAIPIIFITAHGDIEMSVRAMKAGALEFLTKPFREQDLLDAVMQAIGRDTATRAEHARMEELTARFDTLSRREREIMTLVVTGMLNKQIASELEMSEATVKMHRGNVMRKMAALSVVDLVKACTKLTGHLPKAHRTGDTH